MHFTEALKEHALKDQPIESCGLIFQENDQYIYRPYPNVWEAPSDHPENDKTRFFRIDFQTVTRAFKTRTLVGVGHSHTQRDEQPTETDRAGSDATNLPYYIYSTLTDKFSVYHPRNEPQPLIGRPYVPLVQDCFPLVAEYAAMHIEGCELPYLEHTIEDSLKGKTTGVAEYLEKVGWKPVSTVRPFDVAVMIVKSHNFPNHLGIIMEDGKHILHHLYHRKSEIHLYDGYWKRATMLVLRHPHFFKKND